ncbi:MAG: magnesium transporter [Deltaproteobacteria bacterium]|nr:magnesium transporter [Deltaproteobacteria bacterium]NIS76456.1 magnesium transporter [Deltaproteobacteria bacterium]
MLLKEQYEKLLALVENVDDDAVGVMLTTLHPSDIADFIEVLDEESKKYVFSLLDSRIASDVIAELNVDAKGEILDGIEATRLAAIVDEMDSDDAADIFDELSPVQRLAVLEGIDEEDRAEVTELLKYEDDTAGGIMSLEFIYVYEFQTVQEVINLLRVRREQIEQIHFIYVVDKKFHLRGIVRLVELLLSDPKERIIGVMEPAPYAIKPETDQEEVAKIFKKYDTPSMPVVDSEGKLLGRITFDDVMDVVDEEATEDFLRLANVDIGERVFADTLSTARKRLPWLSVNLFTALLAAWVVGLFENTIGQFAFLAVFMPIVAGMGGNAGTQTLTVVVRGIALGDLDYGGAKRVLLKEIMVGLLNGMTNGLLMGVVAYLWKGLPVVGLAIFLAMVINLFVAASFGTIVPLFLRAIKIDPALASGVIVTTATDCMGFLSFLGLSTLLLKEFI